MVGVSWWWHLEIVMPMLRAFLRSYSRQYVFLVVVAMRFFWMGWDSGNCWCKRPVQYLSFARRSCCAMRFWRIPMLGWTDVKILQEGFIWTKNPWQINESTKTDLTALVDTLTGLVTSNIWRIRRFTHPGCFAKTQGPVDQFGRSNLSQPWR